MTTRSLVALLLVGCGGTAIYEETAPCDASAPPPVVVVMDAEPADAGPTLVQATPGTCDKRGLPPGSIAVSGIRACARADGGDYCAWHFLAPTFYECPTGVAPELECGCDPTRGERLIVADAADYRPPADHVLGYCCP